MLLTQRAEYARVAQLVEYDLAKVGVAGSSPVSRSCNTKTDIQMDIRFCVTGAQPTLKGSSVSASLRSVRNHAVHRTALTVSRSYLTHSRLRLGRFVTMCSTGAHSPRFFLTKHEEARPLAALLLYCNVYLRSRLNLKEGDEL